MKKIFLLTLVSMLSVVGAWADVNNVAENENSYYFPSTCAQTAEPFVECYDLAAGELAQILTTTVNERGKNNLLNATNIKISKTSTLNKADLKALASCTNVVRLDIDGCTFADDASLSDLQTSAKYISLPAGQTELSATTLAGCTNLCSAISLCGDNNSQLVGYVKTAGTLMKSIEMNKDIISNLYNYTIPSTITSLKLSGNLNAFDISQGATANAGSETFITTEDIKAQCGNVYAQSSSWAALNGAQFATIDLTDAVFANYKELSLVANYGGSLTSISLPTSMTTIPAYCLYNCQKITELCILKNYEKIEKYAFHLMNGCTKFYTDEKNDKNENIGDHGVGTITLSSNLKELEDHVFGTIDAVGITDVYVNATSAPKCARLCFATVSTCGNGGYTPNHPLTRSCYKKSETVWFAVLHFPYYTTTEEQYTDVTRVYTMPDETGATDGDGKLLMWPTLAELDRSFEQGTWGYTWDAWQKDATKEGFSAYKSYSVTEDEAKALVVDDTKTFSTDYAGWHEFVLASSFDPDLGKHEEVWDISRFKKSQWYTVCLPFDATKQMLGKYLGQVSGETITKYPDVRALVGVTRDLRGNGSIKFKFSKNLCDNTENQTWDMSQSSYTTGKSYYISYEKDGEDENAEDIVMYAGCPYLIKPYLSDEDFAAAQNGKRRVMVYSITEAERAQATPKQDYIVNAKSIDKNGADQSETADGQESTYYYQFVGTFDEGRGIPKYAYFMSGNKWWRNTDREATAENAYKWNPYSAIMGAYGKINGTTVTLDADKKFTGTVYDFECIQDLLEGEKSVGAKIEMVFDGEESGEVTGIDEVKAGATTTDGRIYNINGQQVNKENLGKGLYIINGKKYVVK